MVADFPRRRRQRRQEQCKSCVKARWGKVYLSKDDRRYGSFLAALHEHHFAMAWFSFWRIYCSVVREVAAGRAEESGWPGNWRADLADGVAGSLGGCDSWVETWETSSSLPLAGRLELLWSEWLWLLSPLLLLFW